MADDKCGPILVVEDVREISSQMGAMLNGKGHRVTYATDAESAIKMAENERPKMILTDLDLPTFNDLVALVRKHADCGVISNPEEDPGSKQHLCPPLLGTKFAVLGYGRKLSQMRFQKLVTQVN